MKKMRYIEPLIEVISYEAEEGFTTSVALEKDDILIEMGDKNIMRNSEEITEYTDAEGEYSTGMWGDF